MSKSAKLVINAIGRAVPTEVNGKPVIPYKGVGKHKPEGKKFGPRISSCADFPEDGNKLVFLP
jgi:citrate lyase subunit alpha/citrate CoA-transferase